MKSLTWNSTWAINVYWNGGGEGERKGGRKKGRNGVTGEGEKEREREGRSLTPSSIGEDNQESLPKCHDCPYSSKKVGK